MGHKLRRLTKRTKFFVPVAEERNKESVLGPSGLDRLDLDRLDLVEMRTPPLVTGRLPQPFI